MLLCHLEALVNQINVVLRHPASVGRFFLEAVQYVNHLGETYRVNRLESIAHVAFRRLLVARQATIRSSVNW